MNEIMKETNISESQVDLIKRTICKGASNEELELFLHACRRTKLDPFMKQIYAVKRWDKKLGREVMTIQTSIDGFRVIAERTGKYAPGKKSEFEYGENKKITSATAYVKKMTPDGTWHEVSATAFYEEYVQLTKEGVSSFWARMPHVMLGKCAESVALRKAFPAELSGIYTHEEMSNSTEEKVSEVKFIEVAQEEKSLGDEQVKSIVFQLQKMDNREEAMSFLKNRYKIETIEEIKEKNYSYVMSVLKRNEEKRKGAQHGSATVA